MSLTGLLINFMTKKSVQRFEAATKDPVRVQADKILGIIQKNADTDYGRRYGFAAIKTLKDFQKQVPIISYEDIRADMERLVAGEKRIFTAENAVMFSQTSGTTGDLKYVPVTPTCQGREHSDPMRTWTYHAMKTPAPSVSEKADSEIPTMLDRLIGDCLAKDPAARPRSAQEMIEILNAIEDVGRWEQKDARRWWETHAERIQVIRGNPPITI